MPMPVSFTRKRSTTVLVPSEPVPPAAVPLPLPTVPEAVGSVSMGRAPPAVPAAAASSAPAASLAPASAGSAAAPWASLEALSVWRCVSTLALTCSRTSPVSVNLMALLSKLSSTCCRRLGSPIMLRGVEGQM